MLRMTLQGMLGSCLNDANEVDKSHSWRMMYDNSMVVEHYEAICKQIVPTPTSLPSTWGEFYPDRSRPEVVRPSPQSPLLDRYVLQTISELAADCELVNQPPRSPTRGRVGFEKTGGSSRITPGATLCWLY